MTALLVYRGRYKVLKQVAARGSLKCTTQISQSVTLPSYVRLQGLTWSGEA